MQGGVEGQERDEVGVLPRPCSRPPLRPERSCLEGSLCLEGLHALHNHVNRRLVVQAERRKVLALERHMCRVWVRGGTSRCIIGTHKGHLCALSTPAHLQVAQDGVALDDAAGVIGQLRALSKRERLVIGLQTELEAVFSRAVKPRDNQAGALARQELPSCELKAHAP